MSIRRLFPIILICFVAILAVAATPDPDMWWHLRTGEYIVQNGLPRADVFSFTVPGAPWLTHEWLTEVLMWTIYRAAGFDGLNLMFAAVVITAFWISYLACEGRPYVSCLVVSLAALVAFGSFGVRAQMFNLLFLSLFVLLIERFKDQSAIARAAGNKLSVMALWPLPALTVVWANCHSGFMLGAVLLLAHAIGEGLQAWLGVRLGRGLDLRGIRTLGLTAVGCLAAALLNPHGFGLFTYSYETLSARYVANGWVIEWASPSFHDITGWPFAAMLALGLLAWAFSPRRAAVTDVMLFVGTAAAGLYSARHVSLFAISSAPIICRTLVHGVEGSSFHSELTGASPEPATTPFRRALYSTVAVGMVVLAIVHGHYNLRAFDRAIGEKFPVAAVDFIEREGMAEQRVYNNYGWGGYLIWRGIPVFIDGRADVYGDEFIRKFVKAHFGQDDWRQPLDEYGVEYALLLRDSRLRTLLLATREWREVYRDHLASVLVRATMQEHDAYRRCAKRFGVRREAPLWISSASRAPRWQQSKP